MHVAAAPPPTPRSVLLPPRLGVQGNTQPPRRSTIKAPHCPSREGTPHHRAAIAPIGAHGELHLQPPFTADTCCSRLPRAPAKLPRPLIGHTELQARRSKALSGRHRRRPPHPTASRLSAVCKPPSRIPATPRPSLASFRPPPPPASPESDEPRRPQAPWTTLQSPK
jgi:hypothetical protein